MGGIVYRWFLQITPNCELVVLCGKHVEMLVDKKIWNGLERALNTTDVLMFDSMEIDTLKEFSTVCNSDNEPWIVYSLLRFHYFLRSNASVRFLTVGNLNKLLVGCI